MPEILLDAAGNPVAPAGAVMGTVIDGNIISPSENEHSLNGHAEIVMTLADGTQVRQDAMPEQTYWVVGPNGEPVPLDPSTMTGPDVITVGNYNQQDKLLGLMNPDYNQWFMDENGQWVESSGAAPAGQKVNVLLDPVTGQLIDVPLGTLAGSAEAAAEVAADPGGGGGGGTDYGGGYGGGYSNQSQSGYGYQGPKVAYANGYVPIMFGGKYTYPEWLRMQYPQDQYDSGGPAPLPDLPWKNSQPMFDPFFGNPPFNPFQQQQQQQNTPLAKQLYQKYAGKFGTGAGSYGGSSSYGSSGQGRQNADFRQAERQYTDYQNALAMQQNPIWGLRDYLGNQDDYEGPAYDLFNSMPLQGLQYLLNAKDNASKFQDPGKYQKQLQQMYKEIGTSNDEWNYDQLMKSLWSGGKKSVMTSLFQTPGQPEAQYDSSGGYTGMKTPKPSWANPAQQMASMNMLLGSVYNTTMDPNSAATWSAYADRQMADWANKQYRRNPNNYGDIRKYMKRRVV